MTSLTISAGALTRGLQIGRLRHLCRQTLQGTAVIDIASIARVVLFFGICAAYFMFFG